MNELIKRYNIFQIIRKLLINNYKYFIISASFLVVIFILVQLYQYNKSQNILKNSILYDQAISDRNSEFYNKTLSDLSKDKTFYSVLATLENIKNKLMNNEIELAYNDYIYILENKNLSNLYKSVIAIQASYNFINKVDFIKLKKEYPLFTSTDIYKKINSLILLVDDNIDSFQGYKLELIYLLLILEQDYNEDKFLSDEAKKIYEKIQQSDIVSSSLKERLKKINDIQKYK